MLGRAGDPGGAAAAAPRSSGSMSSSLEYSSSSMASKAACLAVISAIAASWLFFAAALQSPPPAGGVAAPAAASSARRRSRPSAPTSPVRSSNSFSTHAWTTRSDLSPNSFGPFPALRPATVRSMPKMEWAPSGANWTAARRSPPRNPTAVSALPKRAEIPLADTCREVVRAPYWAWASALRWSARERSWHTARIHSEELLSGCWTLYRRTAHISWCMAGDARTAALASRGSAPGAGGASCHSGFHAPLSTDRSSAASSCSRE